MFTPPPKKPTDLEQKLKDLQRINKKLSRTLRDLEEDRREARKHDEHHQGD